MQPLFPHLFKISLIVYCIFSSLVLGTDENPNYEDDILPIFENSCNNCHNADKEKGGLDLSSYSRTISGGSGGPIAQPGEGVDSLIFGCITATMEPIMPPKGERLDKKEINLIRAWIDNGLLENSSGRPRTKAKPKITFGSPDLGKPKGPPAMPRDLLIDPILTTDLPSPAQALSCSPWAPLLAVTGQEQVILYHTETLELIGILPFPYGQPVSLSFHPSGKYLISGGGIGGKSGTCVVWDITTGEEVLKTGKEYDTILAADIRPDMTSLALGGPSRLIKLWDTSSDTLKFSIKKHTDWITALSFSKNGNYLATADRHGGLSIWQSDSDIMIFSLRGHTSRITNLRWSHDSRYLASTSEDSTLRIWDIDTGKEVKKLTTHKPGILGFDWAKDGSYITSGRDNIIRIWSPEYKELHKLTNKDFEVPENNKFGYTISVAINHNNSRFFTSTNTGHLLAWDMATKKLLKALSLNPPSLQQQLTNIKSKLDSLPGQKSNISQTIEKSNITRNKAKENHISKTEELKQTKEKFHNAKQTSLALIQEEPKIQKNLQQLNQQQKQITKQLNSYQLEIKRIQSIGHQIAQSKADIQRQLTHSKQQVLKLTTSLKAQQKLPKNENQTSKNILILQTKLAKENEHLKELNNTLSSEIEKHRLNQNTLNLEIEKRQKSEANLKSITTNIHNNHNLLKKLKHQQTQAKQVQQTHPNLIKKQTEEVKNTQTKLNNADSHLKKSKKDLSELHKTYDILHRKIQYIEAAKINKLLISEKKQLKNLTIQLNLDETYLKELKLSEPSNRISNLQENIKKTKETIKHLTNKIAHLQKSYIAAQPKQNHSNAHAKENH